MINLIANLTINLLLALHSGLAGVYEIISKKVYCDSVLLISLFLLNSRNLASLMAKAVTFSPTFLQNFNKCEVNLDLYQ